MAETDYIIVGNGLAGSILALSLMKENQKVLVIDDFSLSSSSKVAAGLFQPMTFKRTVETWKGKDSIQTATSFYRWAEEILETDFFHSRNMFRMFSSYEEQNNWALKSGDPRYSELIGEEKNPEADSCQNKFGYGKVNYAGYLDVASFLKATERWLIANQSLRSEKFNYEALIIDEQGVRYKEVRAKRIVFCEGWLVRNNPWFSYVPMKPVKGEVLTIELGDKKFESIISGGLFCVPRNDGSYKVGSNYDWNQLDEFPTEKTKVNFTNEIAQILSSKDIFVKSHKAGVRPASHDRRPVIGAHPQYEQLLIFNGLGARGVALGPYTADYLIQFLLNKTEIPEEINLNRFKKYFLPSTPRC